MVFLTNHPERQGTREFIPEAEAILLSEPLFGSESGRLMGGNVGCCAREMWWTHWIITWAFFPHRKRIKQITWEIKKKRYNFWLPKRLQPDGGWSGLTWLIKQHMRWMSTVTFQETDKQCEQQQLRASSMRSGRRGLGLVGDYAFLR